MSIERYREEVWLSYTADVEGSVSISHAEKTSMTGLATRKHYHIMRTKCDLWCGVAAEEILGGEGTVETPTLSPELVIKLVTLKEFRGGFP